MRVVCCVGWNEVSKARRKPEMKKGRQATKLRNCVKRERGRLFWVVERVVVVG